jgi:signal peptidase I
VTDKTSREIDPGVPSPSDEGPSHRAAASSRPRGLWHAIREVVSVAAIALVISFLIKTFVMQAFWIPSGSMEQTLLIGDRVLVSKIQAGPMDIDRGDIVVFEDPGGWLPPTTPVDRGPILNPVVQVLEFVGLAPVAQGNHLIKRVIGTGGDQVVCCDAQGRMSVNGKTLEEEDYLFPGDEPSQTPFDVTVPEGHVWLMGDHRSNSRDSRGNDDGSGATGSVPEDNVVGQAMVLVWPLARAEWFDNPATLSEVPAP